MYADRYAPKPIDRRSMALSVAIVGGLVTAVALSNTVIEVIKRDPAMTSIWAQPLPPPPPPDPQTQPRPRTRTEERIDQPVPRIDSRTDETRVTLPDPGPPPMPPGAGDGGGTGVAIDPPKPPPPLLRGADVDSRYYRDFQPVYPAEERRAGREGAVTIRVLIGTDGRVREVERLAAASDAFWRVTESRALTRWRFRPATRDGVAYESWKTMTVRFRLEEE